MKHLLKDHFNLLLFFLFMFIHSLATSQVTFSDEEVLLLAEHNTERLYLKDLTELQSHEIDSLYKKVELIQSQFSLCQENQETLNGIIEKLNEVDAKRQEQTALVLEENERQKKQIDKQNRKLNRWRIIAPIVSAGAFVVGIFIK